MMNSFDWHDREDSRVINALVGMIAALLVVACLALWVDAAFGAWGPAGCPTVVGSASVNPPAFKPGWYDQSVNGRPGFWGFYDGKVYQADYRVTDNAIAFVSPKGEWSPYIPAQLALNHFGLARNWPEQPRSTDAWADVRESILAAAYAKQGASPAVREERSQGEQPLPTGVDEPATEASPSGYFYGGTELPRAQAMDLVTNGLPDSKHKPWLVAIGPEDYLTKVGTLIQPYLDKFRVQLYDPADWAVERFVLGKNPRFKEKGRCLLIQAPGGANDESRVIHLQYDIDDGAEGLAKVMAAFDPTKIPDLRNPGGFLWPDWVPTWARNWQTVAFIVIALLAWTGRKESK